MHSLQTLGNHLAAINQTLDTTSLAFRFRLCRLPKQFFFVQSIVTLSGNHLYCFFLKTIKLANCNVVCGSRHMSVNHTIFLNSMLCSFLICSEVSHCFLLVLYKHN